MWRSRSRRRRDPRRARSSSADTDISSAEGLSPRRLSETLAEPIVAEPVAAEPRPTRPGERALAPLRAGGAQIARALDAEGRASPQLGDGVGRAVVVRVRRELERGHGERLRRRPAVPAADVERARRRRVRGIRGSAQRATSRSRWRNACSRARAGARGRPAAPGSASRQPGAPRNRFTVRRIVWIGRTGLEQRGEAGNDVLRRRDHELIHVELRTFDHRHHGAATRAAVDRVEQTNGHRAAQAHAAIRRPVRQIIRGQARGAPKDTVVAEVVGSFRTAGSWLSFRVRVGSAIVLNRKRR